MYELIYYKIFNNNLIGYKISRILLKVNTVEARLYYYIFIYYSYSISNIVYFVTLSKLQFKKYIKQ